MKYLFFNHQSFGYKILVFSFLAIFGIILLSVLSIFFPKEESLESMRWLEVLSSLCCFAFPALITSYMFKSKKQDFLRLKTRLAIKYLGLAILLMPLLIPLINLLAWYNQQISFPHFMGGFEAALHGLEDLANGIMNKMLARQTPMDLLANLFVMALMPAIAEELFFRGALLRLLQEKFSIHASIWISAFIFSAYHMQFFGFFPRFLLGALLGYLMFWSNSIYLSMFAHFINNAVLVFFVYLLHNGYIHYDIEKIGIEQYWWEGFVSLMLTLPIILFFIREHAQKGRLLFAESQRNQNLEDIND